LIVASYKLHHSITERRVLAAVERHNTSLDNPGFCLACGAEAHGVEPDARRYVCESCGMRAVYGAEEVMSLHFYWPSGTLAPEGILRKYVRTGKFDMSS